MERQGNFLALSISLRPISAMAKGLPFSSLKLQLYFAHPRWFRVIGFDPVEQLQAAEPCCMLQSIW